MEPRIEQHIMAQNLAYDILEQLFYWCLPEDPLNHRQPDVTQAPMLLCHICARWRAAALSTPALWTSLYYVAVKKPTSVAILDKRDIDFLRWWRKNIGDLQPSLRLSATDLQIYSFTSLVSADSGVHASEFMAQLVISAQYLHLDMHCAMALRPLLDNQPITSPALNTLVLWENAKGVQLNPFILPVASAPFSDIFIPISQHQVIRRLLIYSLTLCMSREEVISFMGWSHMTHIIMNARIDTLTWISFVRKCTSLVSGHFELHTMSHITESPNITMTLPCLRHLCILFNGPTATPLLKNLHLPSLTALALRHTHPSIGLLHLELQSTPALKELHISGPMYGSGQGNYAIIPGDLDHGYTLHHLAPNLEFLHLAFRIDHDAMYSRPDVFRALLRGTWLQLGAPGNRIKRIQLSKIQRFAPSSSRSLLEFVQQIQQAVPPGVQLYPRPTENPTMFDEWDRKYPNFTDKFEDTWFHEHL